MKREANAKLIRHYHKKHNCKDAYLLAHDLRAQQDAILEEKPSRMKGKSER